MTRDTDKSTTERYISVVRQDDWDRLRVPLCVAGSGAVATGAVVLAFSPWFRRWNPAITRVDVIRKVSSSSAVAGCIGYALARQTTLLAEEEEDDSRRTMRNVRTLLYRRKKSEFLPSYSPPANTDIEQPDDTSPAQLTMSEKILSQCFRLLTTSSALGIMRTYLEQDLRAGGVSSRDTTITVTSLANALDQNKWTTSAWHGAIVSACVAPRLFQRTDRSALLGAPRALRVLAFAGNMLLIYVVLTASVNMGPLAAAYATLIQDKDAVAAVLRTKFREELEAGKGR